MRCVRTVVALTLVAAPTALAAGGDRGGPVTGGLSFTREFKPSVVRPGYTDLANPYIGQIRLVSDSAGDTLYSIDGLTPSFVAAYAAGPLQPRSKHGLMLDGTVTTPLVRAGHPGVLLAVSAAGRGTPTTALETVDVRQGKPLVVSRLDISPTALGPNSVVLGMAPGPGRSLVFAATMAFSSGLPIPGTVRLSLIDITGRTAGRAGVVWSQPLSDCAALMTPMDQRTGSEGTLPAPLGYVGQQNSVDIGCSGAGTYGVGYKPPLPTGIGIARLGKGRAPSFSSFVLQPFPGAIANAPAGIWLPGQRRLAFQTYNSGAGAAWWVFDGQHEAFVGGLTTGAGGNSQPALAAGIDTTHGRLYLGTDSGILAADTTPTPLDQGHSYPDLASDPMPGAQRGNGISQSYPNLVVDDRRGRLFVVYINESRFAVLTDSVPEYREPTALDPDSGTIDRAEKEGVTGHTFSAGAQAYGAVYRQVGGDQSLSYNVVPFAGNTPLQKGTRQLATGWLDTFSVTQRSVEASAITAIPDSSNTGADIEQAQADWPYTKAVCSDFGGQPKQATEDGARVACDADGSTGSSTIVGGGSSAAAPGGSDAINAVAVADVGVSAKAELDPEDGMVSTVTATARGISLLGGAVRIGQVVATAIARAHGRPGTAGTTFRRVVSQVYLNNQRLCASQCDLGEVRDRINSTFSGRLRIEFPSPAPDVRRGTPGGQSAAIQRDVYTQTQETLLNDQPRTRLEVPALQATIFEDNTVPSRTIAYLAGVEAEAHYGIYLLGCSTCTGEDSDGNPAEGETTGQGKTTTTSTPVTPGSDTSAPTDAPVVASGPTGVLGALAHGWQVVVHGLLHAIKAFGVWAVLLVPVYLSARRWLLIGRAGAATPKESS